MTTARDDGVLADPPDGGEPHSEETAVWSGTPSQWLNIGWYLSSLIGIGVLIVVAVLAAQPLIAALAIVPAIAILVQYLKVRSTRIDVTTERITTTVGIFSRRKWDMELYRVKDTMLHEPFLLRLVRRANIEIISSDRSSPSVTLPALPDAERLRQQIRGHVERLRLKRGVREMDMDFDR
ncbi:MAG TPA: PH domain-containing protein [Gemmatimonadaceae bacterium]